MTARKKILLVLLPLLVLLLAGGSFLIWKWLSSEDIQEKGGPPGPRIDPRIAEEKLKTEDRHVREGSMRTLLIGDTHFGGQVLADPLKPEAVEDRRRLATAYYHRRSPIGVVLERFNWSEKPWHWQDHQYAADARLPASLAGLCGADLFSPSPFGLSPLAQCWSEPPIAVVGIMGVGALASYGRPYQFIDFYEPNPALIELSLPNGKKAPTFTFLKDALDRGANVRVFQGPPRHALAEKGPDGFYQIVVVEPSRLNHDPSVELLSQEALNLYDRKTTEQAILCFHTSNRHFDMDQALGELAFQRNYALKVGNDSILPRAPSSQTTSHWTMMARKPEFLLPFLSEPLYWERGFTITYEEMVRREMGIGRAKKMWETPILEGRAILIDDQPRLLEAYRRPESRDILRKMLPK